MIHVLTILAIVDIALLRAAKWLIDSCAEWLSLSQRKLEMLLIGVYGGLLLGGDGPWRWSPLSALTSLGCTGAAWLLTRRSNWVRGRAMLDGTMTLVRCGLVAFTLLLVGAHLVMFHRLSRGSIALADYMVFFYVQSWPTDDSKLGRKRKAAVKKLGAILSPNPVPEAA